MISSDFYEFKKHRAQRKLSDNSSSYRPWVSVVIPAFNEEVCIERTVQSVLANGYGYKQIIVVDDASTDATSRKVRALKRRTGAKSLKVVRQKRAGKAAAINNAVKNHAKGSLIMVLDADSQLHPEALTNMVGHFSNKNVMAAASNVKIIEDGSLLGLAQRFEYLISYRTKRALSMMNIEYIIGGVGSTFRKYAIQKVGYYDTDTMTEDIDFTLKLIRHYGNKNQAISYAADVVTYTESVMSFTSLIAQRFRWKYGRLQSLLKNRKLFFNTESKYDKRLTFITLPYALWGEIALLIEPLLVGFIGFIVIAYGDTSSLLSVYIVVTAYILLNIMGETSESLRNKAKLTILAPIMYLVLYILLAVEFAALMQSLIKAGGLWSRAQDGAWRHVDRAGATVEL